MRDEHHEPASPAETAADLSYELARAFVSIAHLLGDDLGAPEWRADEVAAELLRRTQR